MNHRATLGVPNTAGADEIKKAYRKLAMQHHPDRGGDTATFQRVQTAYMELERSGFAPFIAPRPQPQPQQQRQWSQPESPGGTWRERSETIDDIFDQMKSANRGARPRGSYAQPDVEIVAHVGIREAFTGFNMQVKRARANGFFDYLNVNIPPGTPDGHRGNYTLSDGTSQLIITKIESGDFHLRGFASSDSIFNAGLSIGDIETELPIDAIDMITGCWVTVQDFLGENLTVRVPAGFNPLQRLKVANKGYAGWSEEYNEPTKFRRDMYIKLRPVFNKPADIDRRKILNLYNAVGGWENESKQDTV